MKNHTKKMIAPIVITILVVLYYILYFGAIVYLIESTWLKVVLCIVPALLAATMIGVCVQRIKEIKGGEEDDLSKY